MTQRPRILITGATGQVGAGVVPLLATIPHLEVVVAARDPQKAKRIHPGIDVVRLDLDDLSTMASALAGVDRALLVTGYTVDMLRQSKDFINASKTAGVKHIVHLGACGDNNTRIAHYGWHQFVERYIEWSGVTYTHLRPEIFMQNLLGYGGESYVKQGVIRHYIGKARLSWVDIEDVSAVAAAALAEPTLHHGQTYRMGYEAATYDDIARILSRVIGQPVVYEPRAPSEFYQNVLSAGAEPAYMKCVFDSYSDFTAGRGERVDEVFDNLPQIIGRRPRMLEDFARKYADRFRY